MYKLLQKKMVRIINFYKKNGLRESWKQFIRHLGIRKTELVFYEMLSINRPTIKNTDYNMKLKKLTKKDVEKITDYEDGWFDKATALSRLNQGHTLFALQQNSITLFYQWVDTIGDKIDSIDLPFKEMQRHTAYLAYIYTPPEHRGKGFATIAKKIILEYLSQHGYKYLFLVIDPKNIPSIKVNTKVGFKPYQTIIYRKFVLYNYYVILDYNSNDIKKIWGVADTGKKLGIWKKHSTLQ